MKIPVYYICPAGCRVAVYLDALNDAPEEYPVAERSVFGWCDECEDAEGNGVCVLRYEVHA